MLAMLAELCARMGGAPMPAADRLGGYPLAFPDGFTPVITPDRDGASFAGDLLALPPDQDARDSLCRELLALSLGRTGQECAFSLPRIAAEDDRLVLRQRSEPFRSADELEAALERFVNLMEKWRSLASREQSRQSFRSGGGLQGVILP